MIQYPERDRATQKPKKCLIRRGGGAINLVNRRQRGTRVRLPIVNRRQRGTRVRLPKVNRRQRGTRVRLPKVNCEVK